MFKIGETTITKVPELDLNDFMATELLPDLDSSMVRAHPDWIDARVYDSTSGRVFLSVHTWAVRHMGQNILIDTGAGNDKDRPKLKVLDHLRNPYLERLAGIGMRPEEIDYVLLTHIHADHVGWNTRWTNESWVPTFPNTTVICSELEWRYAAALAASDEDRAGAMRAEVGLGDPIRTPTPGVFGDSMLPLEASGRVERIRIDGSEVLKGIRFLPSAGHSIDHAAIAITSEGEEAVFGGDIFHHPLELYMPELVSMFCEFPDAARASRLRLANYAADRGALYCSSHFPFSSAGRITREGSAFGWEFLDANGSMGRSLRSRFR